MCLLSEVYAGCSIKSVSQSALSESGFCFGVCVFSFAEMDCLCLVRDGTLELPEKFSYIQ